MREGEIEAMRQMVTDEGEKVGEEGMRWLKLEDEYEKEKRERGNKEIR